LRWVVTLAAVAVALALRLALDPWLADKVPFITLFGAVIVAAWFGGVGPALLAAALGYAGADFLFIAPRFSLAVPDQLRPAELLAYAISVGLIAALGGARRRARRVFANSWRTRRPACSSRTARGVMYS
jgi:K+-sensing histidine kinase KdpD